MKEKLTYNENLITQFLDESNKIEGVYDGDSLCQAIFAWDYLSSQKEMSIGVVLKAHKILMLHQKLYPNEKGYFRKCNVRVGSRTCPDWTLVPSLFNEWLTKWNNAKTEKNIKQAHIELNKIHIFRDGNGRTSRMIMNYQRLKAGFPLLIIHVGKEQMSYYKWWD